MCGLQACSSPKREGSLVFISISSHFRTRRALFLPAHYRDAADPAACYFHPGGCEGKGHSSCADPFPSVLLFFWREPHSFPQTWFLTGLGCWATLFSCKRVLVCAKAQGKGKSKGKGKLLIQVKCPSLPKNGEAMT